MNQPLEKYLMFATNSDIFQRCIHDFYDNGIRCRHRLVQG